MQEISDRILEMYTRMGAQASQYQRASGLTCLAGCGQCCRNPDVSATPMEMLPMAWKLARDPSVDMQEFLAKLGDGAIESCVLYVSDAQDPNKGRCGEYATRPLLCRLFGATAVGASGGGQRLSVCKLIKEAHPRELAEAQAYEAPHMEIWARQLYALHPDLEGQRLPLNQALKLILQRVLLHLSYSAGDDSKVGEYISRQESP